MADVPLIGDPVLAVAVRAARRASSVVVDAARDLRRLPTFSKEHGDIAAAASDESRGAIVATISAAFPDHRVLGGPTRDAPEAAQASPYQWVVSPIDGATNFAHGYPRYAVSIALAHGVEITHAVVLDPLHDELFTAVRGKGAQLNGSPMRVSACTRLEDALVATVFPARTSSTMAAYLAVMAAVTKRCAGLRPAGASSLDLAYLAAGRLDGYFVTSQQPGDIAAGALLVKEAGGRVGDFAGGTEFLRTREVIAAAPGLFTPLREAIASVRH
ncbi:MAG: inositol monophosphatase [Burkholderiales bacterium]|jgi:myo-inositol-1(or 4)-monophosphatase|nr:inositol monophosphatase [Burkholderiales bacterium]